MLAGVGVMLLGLFLLVQTHNGTPVWDVSWRVFIMGIGLGPGQSLFNVAIQNTVEPRDIGVATASSQFFRQIGSTIGVAVFGTLLTNNLASAARSVAGARTFSLADLEGLAANRSAGPASAASAGMDHATQTILALALHNMFLVGLAILGLGLLVSATIPGARLKGRGPVADD